MSAPPRPRPDLIDRVTYVSLLVLAFVAGMILQRFMGRE